MKNFCAAQRVLMVAALLLMTGWSVVACAKHTQEKPMTSTSTTAHTHFSEPKSATVDAAKKYSATIETAKGTITVSLDARAAPLGVTNFLQLARGGFYDGLTFHRVEPGFVIQGGDPDGSGRGGPGYTLPAEIGLKHIQGALAWARLGDAGNPERRSSGSQFYVTLEATPFLDGEYSVFGHVTAGMDVAEKIRPGDKITHITVTEQ